MLLKYPVKCEVCVNCLCFSEGLPSIIQIELYSPAPFHFSFSLRYHNKTLYLRVVSFPQLCDNGRSLCHDPFGVCWSCDRRS